MCVGLGKQTRAVCVATNMICVKSFVVIALDLRIEGRGFISKLLFKLLHRHCSHWHVLDDDECLRPVLFLASRM